MQSHTEELTITKVRTLLLYFHYFLRDVGFMSIGHRYVGNIGKSIGLLYTGWVIMITSILRIGIVANTSDSNNIPSLTHSNSLPYHMTLNRALQVR
jgi:hypothetical protein